MKIEGIITAMATPMLEDGKINKKELINQVNRHIDAGVDGIFCLGTNGEFYILDKAEKIEVIEICVAEAKGRIPIYAGTGCIGTSDTIELSIKAQEIGVDALSIISPYFAQIDQNQLYQHYSSIARSVDIPIVIYNMPMRTGVNIEPETVMQLAKNNDNIKGIKDSSGNFNNILKYISLTSDEDFSVLSGNDALILWTLLAGGKGGITALANIIPEIMVSIYQYYQKGDIEKAKKAQESITPIRDCLKYGNPNTIVKRSANIIGQPLGPCRAPFNTISEEVEQSITEIINQYYKESIR